MELIKYLKDRAENYNQFAARAGLEADTVSLVARKRVRPRADIALKIIDATRDKPASNGDHVTLRELAKKKAK